MDEKNIQIQINELNTKVDLILDYVNQQRLKSGAVDDLMSDVSIIGKDLYDSVVFELENQAVEIDPEELRILGIKLIKNIKNFNTILELLESITDFTKDAAPIANEMIIDFTKKISVIEQKGYFEFFIELSKVFDNIVTQFTIEDVRDLADKIVPILEMVKEMTQPDMLDAVNNAVTVFKHLETTDIPEYSVWKMIKEMNSPEMKKGIGFIMSFMKNLTIQQLKTRQENK